MAGGSSVELWRDIQILFDTGTASGLTDRQLLERFIQHRDPAAFEVLVLRHGPMVLRVCRNLLRDPNDAHDAFQATFLILVRRAGSIRRLDSLGSWLYGVACRAAARVRVGAARRRAVEERAASRVVEAVAPADADDVDRDEFGPIVQEEVRRLPEKYRAAVVLCYWDGLTHEQAAAQLGCPLGTVRSRLARARDLLRRRLARRGLESLAIGMDSIRRLPPPAPELVRSTVQAAARVAAGQATNQVVSGVVASLVQRALWRMTMIKLSGLATGAILVGLAGLGAASAARRTAAVEEARGVNPGNGEPAAALPGPGLAGPAALRALDDAAPRQANDTTSPPQDIRANVKAETTIVRILPNGTPVKKGDVICELDAGPPGDQLVEQRIVDRMAEAAYVNARQTREVAEIAVREYVEGEYVGQLRAAEGDILVANAEMNLAGSKLNAEKKDGSPLAIQGAELLALRARIALEKAQSRRDLLVNYTRARKVKELESAVARARADEQARSATWELQRAKQSKLERRIARDYAITSPMDGVLQYLSVTVPEEDGSLRDVAPCEGMSVHPGQLLFRIVPRGHEEPAVDRKPALPR